MDDGVGARRERFEAVYRELYEPICGYALRRVREPEDAAEVIAETFATLSRSARAAPPSGSACTARANGCAPRSHRRHLDSPEVKSMSGRSSIDSLRQLSLVSDEEAAATFGAVGREELLVGVTRLPLGR